MELQHIPLVKIRVPETRVTAVYTEETQELLRSTIEKLGILQPAVVVQVGDHFDLVDGLHRKIEAERAGDKTLECVVYLGEEQDSLLMNLVLNKVRGKTKASEMVTVIASLFERFDMDPDQIKEKTGLSREYIEKLLKISLAAPAVIQALDEETIGVGHAFEISRLPSFIQQEEVVVKQAVYKLPIKELKALVDDTLRHMSELTTEEPPAVDMTPREYHCEGCKGIVAPRYLRPVMLCPDCFGSVWRLAKQAEAEAEYKAENHKN